jgi:hypothetical protein
MPREVRTVRPPAEERRLYSWPRFIRQAPMTDAERDWLLKHVPQRRLTSDVAVRPVAEPDESR